MTISELAEHGLDFRESASLHCFVGGCIEAPEYIYIFREKWPYFAMFCKGHHDDWWSEYHRAKLRAAEIS